MPNYYVGLMSGTSMDGIDAVVVDFSSPLADETLRLVCAYSHPWPDDVYQQLMASRDIPDEELHLLHDLDIRLGTIFAEATRALLDKANLSADAIIAIGNHGQTVRHRPDASRPFSLQIGDAKTLAQQTGIRVISDFRSADIAAGGQGAPLAPAFHAAVFSSETEARGVLNIGGIANLTALPAGAGGDEHPAVIGFDTGPGNTLMDAWMKKTCGRSFDDNGEFARSGQINEALLKRCLSDAYFHAPPAKSTGFELFNLDWLSVQLDQTPDAATLSSADIQATLCELSARSISDAVSRYAGNIQHLLVCGGGVHNTHLMASIRSALPECQVESTQVCGIHPDWVEAVAFAWLAKRRINNQAGNLPSVTGAGTAVMLGQITDF